MNLLNKNITRIILGIAIVMVLTLVAPGIVFAEDCDTGAYGDVCIVNKSFEIRKWVKLEGDDTWQNEVTIDLDDDDEADKKILFKVKVKNRVKSDDMDVDDLEFDDMKMKDIWPDELDLDKGDSDDLTEKWDNFKSGETETFYYEADIEEDEKDRDEVNFEKCVVNKAELYYEDDLEGVDDAVVCWKKSEKEDIEELPDTGAPITLGFAGFGLIALGTLIKKSKKYA